MKTTKTRFESGAMIERVTKWMKIQQFSLKQWLFEWIQDDDGDLGIRIAKTIILLKYKDVTIIYFPWNQIQVKKADKWQGHKVID